MQQHTRNPSRNARRSRRRLPAFLLALAVGLSAFTVGAGDAAASPVELKVADHDDTTGPLPPPWILEYAMCAEMYPPGTDLTGCVKRAVERHSRSSTEGECYHTPEDLYPPPPGCDWNWHNYLHYGYP